MERIRHQHLRRTIGKREVNRQHQLVTRQEERKKRTEGMKYTRIKIPESMFPNRYTRGELPCAIEHGVRGTISILWNCCNKI